MLSTQSAEKKEDELHRANRPHFYYMAQYEDIDCAGQRPRQANAILSADFHPGAANFRKVTGRKARRSPNRPRMERKPAFVVRLPNAPISDADPAHRIDDGRLICY